jgi:hypothetical protein
LEGAYSTLDKAKEGPPEDVEKNQQQMEVIYGGVKSAVEGTVGEGQDPFTQEGFNLVLNSVVGGDDITIEQSNELFESILSQIPKDATPEEQKEMLIVGLTEALIRADEDGDANVEAEDLKLIEAEPSEEKDSDSEEE